MPRYEVTLSAEMGITADDENEALRNCDSDAREFVAENDVIEVEGVVEASADHELTEDLGDIQFHPSEVVDEAEEGSVDWTMKGVYSVVVDAENEAQAIETAKALPRRLAREGMLARYVVTLTALMNVTAEEEAEAIRYCDDDAREFVVQNDSLEVKAIHQVAFDAEEPTEDLDGIRFQPSEVVRAPEEGSVDWLVNGVYSVVVDAISPTEAGELAKALPARLGAERTAGPSI